MSRTKKYSNNREAFIKTERRFRRWRVTLAVFVFLFVSIVANEYIHPFGLRDMWRKQYATLVDKSINHGLVIEKVLVQGRAHTNAADVLAALNNPKDQPMLLFNPTMAKANLESLPWVKSAQIERHFPDTLTVILQERKPMALWQQGKDIFLVDDEAHVISGVAWQEFSSLPLLVGEKAPIRAHEIFATLDGNQNLKTQVRALSLIGDRRWNVYLTNGTMVMLPEDNATAAWQKLADLNDQHQLIKDGITAIDLRLPDRVSIKRNTQKIMNVKFDEQT